jgi:hypothetical protein
MEPKQTNSRFSINWNAWLPSRGNVLFTLVVIVAMFWAQSANALPSFMATHADPVTSTGTLPYQGRLANNAGTPITNTVPMIFRLYNASTGGVPLWEENRTGPNSVQVSDGLFNVMLGGLMPIPQNVISGNDSLWLGITAGTDDEMIPRVQLGSVPFALTVPDGSITAEKFAPGAIASVPVGTVVSWWRATADTPLPSDEWAIADGSIVTDSQSPLNGKTLPNLTNRFVMGVTADSIGQLGGNNTLNLNHSHVVGNHSHTIPSHTHTIYHDHNTTDAYAVAGGSLSVHRDITTVTVVDSGAWSGITGNSQPSTDAQLSNTTDIRPSYVGLVYIIKIK